MSQRQPSQARIQAMVSMASRATGVSVVDISFSRRRAAVLVRHRIWRDLHGLGFRPASIARAWGVDHTTVHYALRGRDGLAPLIDRMAA